jgi:2'-5' RNA ligase
VEASDPLRLLARRCERAARRAGLPPERRAWRPHVTLAYLRGGEPARVAAWIQAHNLLRTPPFTVANFGLYSSWRTAQGSRYRLERFYRLA